MQSRWKRLLAGLVLTASHTTAQTYVFSDITSDTTWDADDSPFILLAEIRVRDGATLQVHAGVEVLFVEGTGLTIGEEDTGPATLDVRGHEDNPVTFTSVDSEPVPGSWGAIIFGSEATDAQFDTDGSYVSGTKMDWAVVEYGGAVGEGMIQFIDSAPLLRDCVVQDSGGRGLRATTVADREPRLLRCSFLRNGAADLWGGGIRASGAGPVWMKECVLESNLAEYGAGILIEARGSQLQGCVFRANTVVRRGAGAMVYNTGSQTVFRDCDFINNSGWQQGQEDTWGVGLYVETRDVSLYGCRFIGNTATGTTVQGGAIGAFDDRLLLADCLFASNAAVSSSALARGGAIMHRTDADGLIILRCEFIDNFVVSGGDWAEAGAVWVGGARVQACTFDGNSVRTVSGEGTVRGGAMAASGDESVVIGNLFSQNAAEGNGIGGAVSQDSNGAVYAANSFIDNLAGADGGAMYISEYCSLEGSRGLFNRFLGNQATRGSAVYNALPFNAYGYNDIPAGYICWDINDLVEIESAVHHFFDDPTLSIVGYWPLADCDAVCMGDWEHDGDIDTNDVVAFIQDYTTNAIEADVTEDGIVDTRDIIRFLQVWAEGC